jgi:DNA gyrase subunit A
VIQLIRSSQDSDSAKTGLIERFGLDADQAQAILEMQLRRIAALERERIDEEYQQLQQTISGLQSMLSDSGKVLAEVRDETFELKKSLRQPRRTDISLAAHELSREELEAHEQVVVTLSKGGYIKRIPANTYRNQHRGGKGVTSMNTKDDDPVEHIMVVDTHDSLLFFTNTGRVLKITAYELRPDVSRNTRGVPVVNVMPLASGEKVKAVIGVRSLEDENAYLLLSTRKGSIKRLALNSISRIRPSGLIIMNLKEDDALVAVRLAYEHDDAIIVTELGMSIRFPAVQVTPHSRTAGGMKGITLRPKDKVVSMDVGNPETRLLVISKLGYGKLTQLNKYRVQKRGGVGTKTFNITKKTGNVAAAELVEDDKEVYVVSEQANVIRTSIEEIRNTGRATQGVTIFKPAPGDKVTSIACVSEIKEENDAKVPSDSTPQNKVDKDGKDRQLKLEDAN